eukprot:595297_1
MTSTSIYVKYRIGVLLVGIAAGYLLHDIVKKVTSIKAKRIEAQKENMQSPKSKSNRSRTESDVLISTLNLQKHIEGGYYRTTYKSGCINPMKSKGKTDEDGLVWCNENTKRNLMSSIYWLQRESDSKIMSLHCAGCDIVHYFHSGTGLKYIIVDPQLNAVMITTLGPNIEKGHGFQLIVPKHCWIAAIVIDAQDIDDRKERFALVSEACCPGFDFRDWKLITRKELSQSNLNHDEKQLLQAFIGESSV